MFKAVIFDLDGTVGDTLPLCIAAFRQAIEPYAGKTLADNEIIATFGPSEEGTVRALVPPEHYERALDDYIRLYRQLHGMCPQPFDGIRDILRMLRQRGAIVAMVTGKGRRSCDITLERYGIAGCFGRVETGSPLGPVKPEGIRAVLEHYGLKPGEAVYVGDSPSDIVSSREAGVAAVAAAWAPGTDASALKALAPDKLFTSVDQLRDFLQNGPGVNR